MSLTKEQVQALFRETAEAEFQEIPPENAITHTFSDSFVEKTETLLTAAGKTGKKVLPLKRIAVVALVVMALFASAVGVKAVREPVSRFITEVYEHCLYVLIEGKMHIAIQTPYRLTRIPEGYTAIGVVGSEQIMQTLFIREDGALLCLEQTTAAAGMIPMDTKAGTLEELSVEGVPVLLYESEAYTQVYWIKDCYCFSFTHEGEVSARMLLDLIPAVQP